MTDTNSPGAGTPGSGRGIGDEIRERSQAATEAAKETAREYAEKAREEAYHRGEAYRDYAADETGKVAAALRKASDDLSEGSPQERMIGRIADEVADAADRMRGMTIDDVLGETNDFARRHPGAFLAGAALVGFAAARFLKATSDDEPYAPDTAYSPPPPPPSDSAGMARPMPSSAPSSNAPAPSAEPVPGPATQPAGTTSSTSPAGTPSGVSPSTAPATPSSPGAGTTGRETPSPSTTKPV